MNEGLDRIPAMDDVIRLARRKIVRALEHANAIDRLITDYTDSTPFQTFLKPESEHEHWELLRQPPEEVSLLAGELFYQVRSALDHVFYLLVERNQRGITLPKGWQRECQFPLNVAAPTGSATPVPRDKFPSPARDGISDKAFSFIERIQPYYRANDDAAAALYLLTKFANIDKHRRLNTIVVRVDLAEVAEWPGGGRYTGMRINVEPGAELSPPSRPPELADLPMHMKRRILPVVAFNEPDVVPPSNARVERVVHNLPNCGMWIVNCFGTLLQDP